MRNFNCERRLDRAVLCYITNFMNSHANESRLQAIFKELDQNHDGTLTVEELKDGFKECLGDNMMVDSELDAILKQVDFNNNGLIEYSEFLTACTNIQTMMSEKYLLEAFNLFDLD